jgi:hypothetical protein
MDVERFCTVKTDQRLILLDKGFHMSDNKWVLGLYVRLCGTHRHFGFVYEESCIVINTVRN